MKIAFIGNFTVSYTTETHHSQALQDLGHEVFELQEGQASADEIFGWGKEADLIVWVHTHGWETPRGKVLGTGIEMGIENVLTRLRHDGKKVITYHLDLWRGLAREKDMESDPYWRVLDHFFTVDRDMADWLNENTEVKGHYLPAAVAHREAYAVPVRPETHDVIFVGSRHYHPEWPYRQKLLYRLEQRYGDRFKVFPDGGPPVRGRDLNLLYANAKVVVGDTLSLDFGAGTNEYWSDRVYETVGRGGFLIHPYIDGLDDEFKGGIVQYSYHDFDELFGYIDHALENPRMRERVRQDGMEQIHKHGTYLHRWAYILDVIK